MLSYRHYKLLVDVFFGDIWLEVWRLEEAKKELVDQLWRETRHEQVFLLCSVMSQCPTEHLYR